MNNYTEYMLGSICSRLSSGKGITSNNISEEGEYPVYGGNGLRGYTATKNFTGKCAIIGRQGAYCGNVKYFEGEAYMTEHAVVVVANPEHNTKYLAFVLDGLKLGRLSGQAAQPGLSVKKLAKIRVFMPEKSYQDKIANILTEYDLAIENNNKRIKILEQMAENLYKEWFVRFRFPGHEDVEFEGGIPKGWKILKIKDLTSVKSGYAFKSEWFTDEGYCVAKIKDIGSVIMDTNDFSFVNEENCLKAKKFILNEGDLTIALTGATIGKISIVPRYDTKIYTNQRLGKFFNGNNPIDKLPYLYCYFSQKEITQTILNISNSSSAQPNISPEQIEDIKFLGNKVFIDAFNSKTKCIFKQILELHYMNNNLIKQRDLLLPRLMSGKLQVK